MVVAETAGTMPAEDQARCESIIPPRRMVLAGPPHRAPKGGGGPALAAFNAAAARESQAAYARGEVGKRM